MVFQLSRRQIAPRKDPHDWNSWDHYRTIHENRLREHPFVVSDTLAFTDEGEGVISLKGIVHCQKNVMLEVEKWFEPRYFGRTLRVRCHTYVYIGWLPGEHLLLKYTTFTSIKMSTTTASTTRPPAMKYSPKSSKGINSPYSRKCWTSCKFWPKTCKSGRSSQTGRSSHEDQVFSGYGSPLH